MLDLWFYYRDDDKLKTRRYHVSKPEPSSLYWDKHECRIGYSRVDMEPIYLHRKDELRLLIDVMWHITDELRSWMSRDGIEYLYHTKEDAELQRKQLAYATRVEDFYPRYPVKIYEIDLHHELSEEETLLRIPLFYQQGEYIKKLTLHLASPSLIPHSEQREWTGGFFVDNPEAHSEKTTLSGVVSSNPMSVVSFCALQACKYVVRFAEEHQITHMYRTYEDAECGDASDNVLAAFSSRGW